jgi:hypothetical protein
MTGCFESRNRTGASTLRCSVLAVRQLREVKAANEKDQR